MARPMFIPRKQRTRQHVIADQSMNYVERFIIDAGYTAQMIQRDYGYDLLMFTYDEEFMVRTEVTYRQLDKVLRSLGFSCRGVKLHGEAHVYEHEETGARFIFPANAMSDGVLDYHLLAVRTSLDLYGLLDATAFDAKLKKAG